MNNLNVNRELDPVKDAARDVSAGLTEVVRSEIRLAVTELRHALGSLKRGTMGLAIGGSLAVLGIFPILAFLVIALGKLLNDNYWLSSLIIGVLFLGIGAAFAYAAIKKLQLDDLSLPRTRDSVTRDTEVLNRKIREISLRRIPSGGFNEG
jgi:uncharacterized membrane protein YqjE